jgi:hypothetical protein
VGALTGLAKAQASEEYDDNDSGEEKEEEDHGLSAAEAEDIFGQDARYEEGGFKFS